MSEEDNKDIHLIFGIGKIEWVNGRPRYVGSIPDIQDGRETEVIVVKREDINFLIENQTAMLLMNRFQMPAHFYNTKEIEKSIREEGGLYAYLPDALSWNDSNGKTYTLYLERYFFSNDPSQEVWIRYASLERMLMEESPDDPRIT